jgi:nickel-dependent lactate racemase
VFKRGESPSSERIIPFPLRRGKGIKGIGLLKSANSHHRRTISTITLPQLAWYGTKRLRLSLPEDWLAQYYHMPGYKLPALKPEEIRAAVTSLIGLAPIRELARGKKEVVIIFDDMTRVTRTAEVVPSVLEELALAGIPENKIRFICALGNHGASTRVDFVKKLGEDVMKRFPVYNHNPFFNCSYVGTTSAGTKVHVNDEVMKCDFKIAIGSVVPHPTTGFGGGGKIILPGVASIETAQAFHIVPFLARTGN